MPTTVSKPKLDELRDLLVEHIKQTGETPEMVADRAGLKRWFVSQIRSNKYDSSPSLDNYERLLHALGKKSIVVDSDD